MEHVRENLILDISPPLHSTLDRLTQMNLAT